jgi:hypothetical protein
MFFRVYRHFQACLSAPKPCLEASFIVLYCPLLDACSEASAGQSARAPVDACLLRLNVNAFVHEVRARARASRMRHGKSMRMDPVAECGSPHSRNFSASFAE